MLRNSIAVINGKGGVGKTSITATLAVILAALGWKVLIVEFDPQGNVGRDLGYHGTSRDDNGMSIFMGVVTGVAIAPVKGIRTGLDVIPGGKRIKELMGVLYARGLSSGESTDLAIHDIIAPTADDYDMIFMDCPPGDERLQRMALATTKHVLIPTKSDACSLDGLVEVSDLFRAVRESSNPELELLGVILFGTGAGSTRIASDVRAAVARDLGDPHLVFTNRIRHVEGVAKLTRDVGRTATEIKDALPEARRAYYSALRESAGGKGGLPVPRPAAAAEGLTKDYLGLAEEVIMRYLARTEAA